MAQFIGGGGGGGGGAGGGAGAGGGGVYGQQESGGTDLGVLNFLFSGAKTVDPWETLPGARAILQRISCDPVSVAAQWRRGGAGKRAVLELARDVFLYTHQGPHDSRRHEAARRWTNFPERLAQVQGLANGTLTCAAILAQAPPERGYRRASRIRRAAREARAVERANAATAAAAGVPAPGVPTIPPAPGGREPAWLTLVRILGEQYRIYQEQQAQRAREREQRRALRMSLSDTIGDLLGSVAQATPTLLPAILSAREGEANRRAALRLARSNFSALGLPGGVGAATGATAAALASLLGEEPGALEPGGMLETLGLEGDVERTVTLWKRTGGGFRAVRSFAAQNPSTGSISTWLNMGRPVLYSGDLAACRRVNRIASRVARVARRRRAVAGPFRRRRR